MEGVGTCILVDKVEEGLVDVFLGIDLCFHIGLWQISFLIIFLDKLLLVVFA